ncbi:antibiotic biosynthesis monooxygenase [Microbacterium sp. MEC084]|uniref:putative quinol monooxygenase n=1 Tax=Microbacterium sp. MEC084 TaxID=1963027 RepID=UPI00106FE9AA|nr:antibiotic biosynthesis monooxygenase [Microbacterium sp. MEC084]MCD1267279.1 antibiotic biosynthesis monooxygenase [Microbacterium sp. MEC084]
MVEVRLTGELRCADADEARLVAEHLPAHVALTRAEPGCLSFEVTPTADPLVWAVAERFADERAFNAHQARAATSEWGRRTAGIERRYSVEGLAG